MNRREPELLGRIRRAAEDLPATPLHFVADDGTWESVCLGDLVSAAQVQAAQLVSSGLRRGDVVAIRGGGGSRAVAQTILACLLSGCVAAPLVSLLGDADVESILATSDARGFLSECTVRGRDLTPLLEELRERGVPAVIGGIGELAETHPIATAVEAPPSRAGTMAADDPAFVLFSSGTTGMPKGAIHSCRTLLAEVTDFADQLDLGEGGVGLQPFPLGHIGGLAGLFVSLCLGRELVVLNSWDAAVAYDVVEHFGVTATGSTPYFAQTLFAECERRGRALPTLRTMESGGGPVGRELVYRADSLGINLSRGYGSTEHPTACTHHGGDPLTLRAETDGRPLNGSEVRIAGQSGEECPSGTEGEVLLRGPEQFLGYLSGDRSDLTEDGWFRTGDLGSVDEAGLLTVTGRMKDVIIRGGENIAAVEVEDLLVLLPGVLEAAVVGVPDERLGERVHAFVVPSSAGPRVDLDGLRAHFARLRVARYKVPESLDEVSALPRNGLGKVQKHMLRPGWRS